MKCVTLEEDKDILREIHEGVCDNHAASRTLVGKAFRSGFFWPTAVSDAKDLVRRCPGCQFFGKKTHIPTHNLITIPPSWSFASWSLDMIEPLTVAPGGFNHVLVAVDKFTKWIEYKLIVKISSDRAVCKDRWTKRGVNWAFFKFLRQNKATLTYAILVRLNSPTG